VNAPDLETIVTHGLCTGCGLCASLAGRDRLDMQVTTYGQIRPRAKDKLDAATLEGIQSICPGIRVTGAEASQVASARTVHPVWGPIRSLHRGWAVDEAVRFRSAAGGSMTALGSFLLESGKVDSILHVRASSAKPLLTDAQVSTTAEEVQSGAQSRYGPAAPLVYVHRLLDEGRRFALLGKPCDVAAIRNLARIDPRVEEQIPYCLTIFCGGVPTLHTARKIAAHLGVSEDEVEVFRWRGNGWPGPTHVEARDGRAYDLSFDQTWFDPSRPWSYDIPFRCKICPDAIGELGDVCCADGWVMKGGKPIHEEAPGVNVLVARTEHGERLVADAAAAGAIELAPFAIAQLDAMHGDHLPRRLENPARIAALRIMGEPAPRFSRFRRWRMIWRAGLRRSFRAFLGTRRRILAGANREPLL
jgi:coenzyme F420 hydrogenase subunit beta